MIQNVTERVRWTVGDLELLPDNQGTIYEIIDGDLFVTRSPHSRHQQTCGKIFRQLDQWSEQTNLGETILSPGILYSQGDNVIPDVVWLSRELYALLIDEQGHLTGSPELVVEVLSESSQDQRRDREVKLKLYSARGVQEYWIADWRSQKLEIYRRQSGQLKLVGTLYSNDQVTSPLLSGFNCLLEKFFPV